MNWIERFSGLSALDESEQQRLRDTSSIIRLTKGTHIFAPGRRPDSFVIVLEGVVRVQQLSERGREMVLYRVRSGETCVMTTACLLAMENYSAEALAETDVQAVAIRLQTFDDLMAHSADFRRFVFTAYGQRMAELFHVIQNVVFQRMDIRLAQALLELAQDEDAVFTTHRQLAVELGTAREVVSRQLSEFQRRQWVEQSRGRIQLLDIASMRRLAES